MKKLRVATINDIQADSDENGFYAHVAGIRLCESQETPQRAFTLGFSRLEIFNIAIIEKLINVDWSYTK